MENILDSKITKKKEIRMKRTMMLIAAGMMMGAGTFAQVADDTKTVSGHLLATGEDTSNIVSALRGEIGDSITGTNAATFSEVTIGGALKLWAVSTEEGKPVARSGFDDLAINGPTYIEYSDQDESNNFIRVIVGDREVMRIIADGESEAEIVIFDDTTPGMSLNQRGIGWGQYGVGNIIALDEGGTLFASDGSTAINLDARSLVDSESGSALEWNIRGLIGRWEISNDATNGSEVVNYRVLTQLVAAAVSAGPGVAGEHTGDGEVREVVADIPADAVIHLSFSEDVGELASLQTVFKSETNFTYVIRGGAGIITNVLGVYWTAKSPSP